MAILHSIEKGGFTTVQGVLSDVVAQMVAHGFNQIFPVPSGTPYAGEGIVILEPSTTVDPVRNVEEVVGVGAVGDPDYVEAVPASVKPSWRIAFSPDNDLETLQINVATPIQLTDDGTIAKQTSWTTEAKNPGEILKFLDRTRIQDDAQSLVYPMTYGLTISDHGVFLAVWDQAFDEYQNETAIVCPALRWILIQRPVENDTGNTLMTGRAPVFCVYSIVEPLSTILADTTTATPPLLWGTTYLSRYAGVMAINYYKFVVCETDIFRPSLTHPADISTEDSNAILNSTNMVAIAEDNKYVITIPKGLNTSRYAYTHELDMIAYTSADVVGQFTELSLELYSHTYRYKALPSNRLKNTGMRILYRISDPT